MGPAERSFDDVQGGLDDGNALFEVWRFEFNPKNCKGFGIYAAECPCGAIEVVAEETWLDTRVTWPPGVNAVDTPLPTCRRKDCD